MLPLRAAQPPAWINPGAKFDLDFINNRYWGGYVDQRTIVLDKGSLISNNGAYNTTCFTPQKNGVLKVGGSSGQNRITDLGFFCERGATNQALWSRDMTNAVWVSGGGGVSALKNQPTADSLATASGASSITASGANGTILQSVTITSRIFIYSAWIKRLVGSGAISMTVDGGSTYTDVTSQINSSTYTWVQIPQQTLANPSFGFKIGVSGDSIAVDFNQCENGSQVQAGSLATTPIPCTAGSTNVRFNELNYFGDIGGVPNAGRRIITDVFSYGGPWTCLASWNGDVTSTIPNGPLFFGTDGIWPTVIGGGVSIGLGATNHTANQGTNGRGNWNKSVARCNGAGSVYGLNGGALTAAVAANIPNANVGATHGSFANNGSGTTDLPLNGSIGRITLWDREITDGQMVEFTTLVNGV